MPELPEAERIRLTLAQRVVGARVVGVRVRRRDVVQGDASQRALLAGQTIRRIDRLGKQLALVGDGAACVRIRLGMTGKLLALSLLTSRQAGKHVHILWRLAPSAAGSKGASGLTHLAFEDARRFGSVHTHADETSLAQAWSALGPDALRISTRDLSRRLAGTSRVIKAALLDQRVLAGVGNIYADEALHAARIAPTRRARDLGSLEVRTLTATLRATLKRAIDAGGSTIRDFADSESAPGAYQRQHKVYGRGGSPCARCCTQLEERVVAQRTTVWCPRCQQ